MKWIINYIRSCFCKHEWECIAENRLWANENDKMPYACQKVYRCQKCGYIQKVKY